MIHLELHIDVSFDLLCDEPINGLMPRQQLPQPGHLNEADLHNFTDLVPAVAFAVFGASLDPASVWKTAFKTPMIASGGTANELHG